MASALEYTMRYDSIPLSKRFGVKKPVVKKVIDNSDINWSNGIDIVDKDSGLTPLMTASIQGKTHIMKALIDRGADLEFKHAKSGRTPLIFAAKFGQDEAVKDLLHRGAVVNQTDKHDMTALMHASKGGHFKCAVLLVTGGAGINNTDDDGYTALHYASAIGNKRLVEYFCDAGVAVEIRDIGDGKTALHLAAESGRTETALLLIQRGAKVNRRSVRDKFTALMLASKGGHRQTVSMLIANGADSNLCDIYGWTALQFACSWGYKDAALALIVEGYANVNARELSKDKVEAAPPLVVATKSNQIELMKLLMNYGAAIDLPEISQGKCALAFAVEGGETTTIQLLIDYGANVNLKNDWQGATALMFAARAGKRGSIMCLLNNFADINILDNKALTALDYAVLQGKWHYDTFLSAIAQITPQAKVNLIPWVEMECPNLKRNSIAGGPSVFMNNFLYGRRGVFYGLLNMSPECDVYLVYCFCMLASGCYKSAEIHPLDRADLLQKYDECNKMIVNCLKAKALRVDWNMIDTFVLGARSSASLIEYQDKFFTAAFSTGPLALAIDNRASDVLTCPQILERIDSCFKSCLRDPSENENFYGDNTTFMFRLRYIPAFMFLFEGASKAFLLALLIWYTTTQLTQEDYTPLGVSSGNSSRMSTLLILAMAVLSFTYELGLIEEKRWCVSPSVVFHHPVLESQRWTKVRNHFFEDAWRFCDFLEVSLMIGWVAATYALGGNIAMAVGNKLLTLAIVPIGIGLLRYPAGFHKPFGVFVLNIFEITKGMLYFLFLFAVTGLTFGTAFFAVFKNSIVGEFGSSSSTLQTVFNVAIAKTYDPDMFDKSGNTQYGIALSAFFTFWVIIVLMNAIIAHMSSNYQETHTVAEKHWAWIKARNIQQFGLNFEKSPLCMLPPPFNIIPCLLYPPHVHLMWRRRLYSSKELCISLAGTVTDWVLTALALLPCAVVEYFANIYQSEAGVGHKLLRCLIAPIGILYVIWCLIHKAYNYERPVYVILKSRLSDGRLRVSYGIQRDALAKEGLSNFEDKRLFKIIEDYALRHGEKEDDDDDEEGNNDHCHGERKGGGGQGFEHSQGRRDDPDYDSDEEAKYTEDDDDELNAKAKPPRAGDLYSSFRFFKAAVPAAASLYKRKPTNIGRKRGIRIVPSSPFLQLANTGENDLDDVKSRLGSPAKDPKSIAFKKTILMVNKKELQASHYNMSLGESADGADGVHNSDATNKLVILQNGKISPYQPGLVKPEVKDPSLHVDSQASNEKKEMIPPRSTAAEEANNLSSRRLLAGPSIYFRTNKFQAFYEDDEKKIIFQIVLPEEFIDDFAHGLLQNESYLYMLQKRLYDMELQQSKQLQLLNKLLENATLTQVSTASRDVVTSQQEDDYSQYYGVNHQQQSYVQHNPYGPQQQQQQQHYY